MVTKRKEDCDEEAKFAWSLSHFLCRSLPLGAFLFFLFASISPASISSWKAIMMKQTSAQAITIVQLLGTKKL